VAAAALRNLRALLRSVPLGWPLVMFATSGLAFAAANIVWARTLPVDTYAVVALSVAILNLALRLAPFGADLEINRGDGALSRASIRRVAATSALTAVIAGAAASIGYGLSPGVGASLACAVACGGLTVYGAAALQARRRYLPSLALLHALNYLLLGLSLATAATGVASAAVIVGAVAIASFALLIVATSALRTMLRGAADPGAGHSTRNLLALFAITGSAELMTQLDRLVTPAVLSLADLAHLSVLLALVGPPFRLLEMAVAYAILPELRAATTAAARRRALQGSLKIAFGVSALAAVLLLLFLTPVSQWLLGAKFTLPLSLIAVAVFAGLVRVAHGFAGAAATALIPNEKLTQLSTLGIVSVGIGIAGAIFGSRWGLQGVVWGSTIGWLVRTLASAGLVRSGLRSPPAA
jgi:O-antigen/teichoic acid export membrane protein